jgi:uncharacterized protein involved in exopolysaccharide biosynthesis
MVESVSGEDRERLVARLRKERPAEAACAAALAGGATVYAWPDTARASALLLVYRRRLARVGAHAGVLGGEQLLLDLEHAARQRRRLLSRVVVLDRWRFLLMLDIEGDSQACLGFIVGPETSELDLLGDSAA